MLGANLTVTLNLPVPAQDESAQKTIGSIPGGHCYSEMDSNDITIDERDSEPCKWVLLVLVFSGCYNKLPETGWLNNKHLFLTVLEAGKSKIRVWREPTSWFLDDHFHSVPPHSSRKARNFTVIPFIMVLILFMGVHILGFRVSIYEFWKKQTSSLSHG